MTRYFKITTRDNQVFYTYMIYQSLYPYMVILDGGGIHNGICMPLKSIDFKHFEEYDWKIEYV